MDDDNEHEVDDSDNRQDLDSEEIGEDEREMASEWWQHCSVNCPDVSIFILLPASLLLLQF